MKKRKVDPLALCGLEPSKMSLDYLNNKKQFHLHTLITEQRHKKTMDLSTLCKTELSKGLAAIISVDEDVTTKLTEITDDPRLDEVVMAIRMAMENGRKIYVYG